jgi:Kef-type K+ transport system membrane component KefB
MLSWGVIVYGAVLSTVLALLLVVLLARERRPAVLGSVAAGVVAGPLVWNAILRATNGSQFFTDAPISFFPISWQDTGSGVFTLAVLALILGFGPLHASPGRRVALLAGLGALGALLVDIYLY